MTTTTTFTVGDIVEIVHPEYTHTHVRPLPTKTGKVMNVLNGTVYLELVGYPHTDVLTKPNNIEETEG